MNGRVFIAIADGCTGICATDPSNRTPANSRDKLGMMFMLDTGPSLYEGNGILTSVKPSSNEECHLHIFQWLKLKQSGKTTTKSLIKI